MRLVALVLALVALESHVSAFTSGEDLRVNECNRAIANERPLACAEGPRKDLLPDKHSCQGEAHLVPDTPCITKDNPCEIKENFDRMPSECTGLGTVQESYTFVLNDALSVINKEDEKRFSFPNKLFEAFASAWGNHWSLRLRPDDLWTMVGVLVSRILENNHEELRSNFVDHDGKAQLTVFMDGLENHPYKHEYAIDKLYWSINSKVKSELPLLLLNNFTTTDITSKAVSQLLTMSSFRHYFQYGWSFTCGIRSIVMDGSHEEWASLPSRLDHVITAVQGARARDVDTLKHFRRVLEIMQQTSETRLTDDPAKHKEVRDIWSSVLDNVLMDVTIAGGYGPSQVVKRKGLRGWAAALDGRKPGTQIQIDDSGLAAAEGQAYVKDVGTYTAGLLSYSKDEGMVKPEIKWTLTTQFTKVQEDEEEYDAAQKERMKKEAEGWEYKEPIHERAKILELEKTHLVEYVAADRSQNFRTWMRIKKREDVDHT